MNWYIGQPVVAIRNHIDKLFRKGDEFIIKGLRGSSCKCSEVEIDIGFSQRGDNTYCPACGNRTPNNSGVFWLSEKSFAPLDTDISELTEILEREIVLSTPNTLNP